MNNDEFKKNVTEYFDENLPDYDEEMLINLKREYRKTYEKKTKPNLFKKVLIPICCLLILIPSIVLPICLIKKENYYSEDEIQKEYLTKEFTKDYLQNNFSYLSFLFDEFDINIINGYFIKSNNKLASISFEATKNDIPFTELKFNLIADKHYRYSRHDLFTINSKIETHDNYKLYSKMVEEVYTSQYFYLFEYKDYNLFIVLDTLDEDFLTKLK